MNSPRHPPQFACAGSTLAVILSCLAPPDIGRAEIILSPAGTGNTNAARPSVEVPAPESESAASRYDVLEFLNGDKVRGTFYSFDPEKGVRWRHPHIRQVLEIDPAGVASIKLDRPPTTNEAPTQTCMVQLTNEDELVGELLGMDGTNILLRTWYGGVLSIPRERAHTIAPGQAVSSALYEGPAGLEGWKVSDNTRFRQPGQAEGPPGGAWRYRNGAFYCNSQGSIGRDVQLPELSSIEFEMAWSGYLHLALSFHTDNLESYSGDCYMMQFNSGSLYLQRMTKNGNSSNLGHAQVPVLAQKPKATIALRSNKKDKTISLFIDGDLTKQWTDRSDFPSGTGLVFFQQGQGVVRLSKIRVAPWDGKIDQPKVSDQPAELDLVRLGNNDQITGTLQTIENGKMRFGTEFATLEVPLERIDTIALRTQSSDPPARQPADIRAVFADRGMVTLQLERWDDHQVAGRSPNFGPVEFLPSAFSRIDFNLERQRVDPDLLDLGSFDDAFPLMIME